MRILGLSLVAIVVLALGGVSAGPERVVVPPAGQHQPAGAASAAATYNSALRRYPYLTDLVAGYVIVNWATATPGTSGSVQYGLAGSEACTAHIAPATRTMITVNSVTEYQWKAQLTLSPGTRYCYRIFLDGTDLLGSDVSPHFWTQVPAGSSEPFAFAVLSDWGYVGASGSNPDAANVMTQLAASGARFALTAGDNTHPAGTQTEYGDLAQSGTGISGVFGPQYWAKAGAAMALFPAIGNHGLAISDSVHPHFVNWPEDRAVALSGGRYARDTYSGLDGTTTATYPSIWYAFDAGNARFYVLTAAWANSNVGTGSIYKDDHDYHWATGSAEYQWLQNDLATHPSQLKFAFFHFPLYSDNANESSDTYLQATDSLQGLLDLYGVNIAFSGHSHNYQRFAAPNSEPISYLLGGGGAELTPINTCSSNDGYAIGWSYASNVGSSCQATKPTSASQVYHFLLVTVNGTTVTVAPTDSLGRTFDVQTYIFGSPAASPTPTDTPTPTRAATPTATHTPTAAPGGGDIQPALPLRAAFYYPWFPEAWAQLGIYPYTNYHPTLGFYESSNATVIRQHIAAMRYGGIAAGIASWWDQGSPTDLRIPALLAAAAETPFRWAIYYEPESIDDPPVSDISADLIYLRDHYGNDPAFLRINGRFVVFVYADDADGCSMADRWKQANTVNAYIVLKVFAGYTSCASQPDGWHQYAPAAAADGQGTCSYTISPGFYKAGEASSRLERDIIRWRQNIREMIASGARFQLVTTFNEWGEGTAGESAAEWASASGYGSYLDALHDDGAMVATSTPTPTPTNTPAAPLPSSTPTSTCTPTATSTATPTPTDLPPTPSRLPAEGFLPFVFQGSP